MRIPDLNLKFVVHYGQALHQKMAGRDELMGSDVAANRHPRARSRVLPGRA
jgi:hypothetical protein